MTRDELNGTAREFFESLWKSGDTWEFDSSEFEQARFARLLDFVSDRRYRRLMEIGCGAGAFTARLTALAESIVALDISPTAVERGRQAIAGVDFRVANVMEFDVGAEGPWDLIVMTETVYYLGWLYSFFDVGWLFGQLHAATASGGRLLLANTQGVSDDPLTLPGLIHGYRDLLVCAGFDVEREEVFVGHKHDVRLEVLITLLTKKRDV